MASEPNQPESRHPAMPWIGDCLRESRLATHWSRPTTVRDLQDVSVRDAENFELRGPPACVTPLFAYSLAVHAHDEAISAIGGSPSQPLHSEDHPTAPTLAQLRNACGVTQEQLSLALPSAFSRESIARIESGHIAVAAQRFVRYATAIKADLRLIAELLTIAPRDHSSLAVDLRGSIPQLIGSMRAPARRGDLFAVFQLAMAIRGHSDYALNREWRSQLNLCLSIACGLDRRWRAARFFAKPDDGSLPAQIQRAYINCADGDARAARIELAPLIRAAEARGTATLQLLQYQLGHAARLDQALLTARTQLLSVAKHSDEPDLKLSALAELALVEARADGRRAVRHGLDAANEIAPVCDESVAIYRQIQFSRAAHRSGLSIAAELANAAAERAAAIGYHHGHLLALMQMQDQAECARRTDWLRELDESVIDVSLRVHPDDVIRRRVLHTARRLRRQGRATRRVLIAPALPAPTTEFPN